MRWLIAVVVVLVVGVTPARAEKLVLPDIHGEADVADEASVTTMLVRSALGRDPRTLVKSENLPVQLTVATAPAALAKLGADTAVVGELVREGTGLRITLVLVERDGTSNVSVVRAGDGDVRALAVGVLARIDTIAHITAGPVPVIGLGRLRPYAIARRLASTDAFAAAAELADAIPTTANAAPGATWGLHAILGKLPDPTTKLLAARSLAALQEVDAIAANATGPIGAAARALSAIEHANVKAADDAMAHTTGRDGITLLARAILADAHGEIAATSQLVRDTLATDQVRAILAFVSRPDAPRFPPELVRPLLGFAEKSTAPGIASRIGLAAARADIDVPRALALISIRDLDDGDLVFLEPLISTGTTPDLLRLRAELAMRRADSTDAIAIAAYLAGAPDAPRAHLYKGYVLMGEEHYDAAAIEFGKAKASRERAHSLMLANDIQGAIDTVAHAPSTPEEYALVAQQEVAQNKIDDAARDIDIAERDAPASPYVQRVIADVADRKKDKARAALARTIAETGVAKAGTTATMKIEEHEVASGSGSAGPRSTVKVKIEGIDPRLADLDLTGLLAALPQLNQLTSRKIMIAELRWSRPLLSFRQTHPDLLRPVLLRALSAPPYGLLVTSGGTLEERPLAADSLSARLGDADALLLFQVSADGGRATLAFEIFQRGARTTREVSDTVPGIGLVSWDPAKLVPIGIAILILILIAAYFIIRGTGQIKVVIERAPDANDEVFCVLIGKSPNRPNIPVLATFRTAIKKAGTTTKRRSATLIASGIEFRVPPGRWHVHLYGTHERGGVVLALPTTASVEVTVKRNTTASAQISLVPTSAELYVTIEGEVRDGVAVWIDQGDKVFTNPDGTTVIPLAIGKHEVNFEVKGHTFKREFQAPQARIYRFAMNLSRELRLIDAGLDASANSTPTASTPTAGDLDLDSEPSSRAVAATDFLSPAAQAHSAGVRFGKRPATPVADDGRLLDRYRRTAELGRGAMGVVHRAWDENLEREVAIKVMAEELQRNSEAMRLFGQEAKALAQLNHSNIVAVYDQVTVDDTVYMIMEFVDGTTLETMVEGSSAFPWREAIEIADQLCAGLAYAHARRVIHRDIKPANIFIAKDGTVKLGDFGLARIVRELTIRKTEIRGTPLYMAPEQILGTDLDHRVDLYAVGCTMYELVCGRPPFIDGDIMYHQLNTIPAVPSTLRADVPPALDKVIMDLLAKRPEDRPGSANEVRAALKTIS